MIGNWLAYVYNYLVVRIRQPRLVGLIMALIKPGRMLFSSLYSYIDDSRLRSAATWQVCWLEKLLSDTLGYPVRIIESDGRPVDFHVMGVSVNHENLASALLNRYKLAGRSFVFISTVASAQWSNPVCSLTENVVFVAKWKNPGCAMSNNFTFTARWSDPVCAEVEVIKYTLNLSIHPDSTGAATGSKLSKDPDKDGYDYGDVVQVSAADNAPHGYFARWERYQSGGWIVVSYSRDFLVIIKGNTNMRAYYTDGAS